MVLNLARVSSVCSQSEFYDEERGRFVFDIGRGEKHKYVFGFSCDAEILRGRGSVFVESLTGIHVCFYYKSFDGRLVDKQLFKSNALEDVLVPEGVGTFDVYFRLPADGFGEVTGILLAGSNELFEYVSRSAAFKGEGRCGEQGFDVSEKHVFLIETVFCDVETRGVVLEKYLSFLLVQIRLMKSVLGKKIFWVIYMSDDKVECVKAAQNVIEEAGLGDNIFVVIYSHPDGGYNNQGETHIDRLLKPNVTYPGLREGLFVKAKEAVANYLDGREEYFIRGCLDDDDFLNPKVFIGLDNIVRERSEGGSEGGFIVINRAILVSYFGCVGESVFSKYVEFGRVVNGCKFSIGFRDWGASPYAISETISEKDLFGGARIPVIDCSYEKHFPASYSYNRTYTNLSGNNKEFFFNRVLSEKVFSSQDGFLRFFCS